MGGKHGTLDGVRRSDLTSAVTGRIAAKLGLSEAATSKGRLVKAGKQLKARSQSVRQSVSQ
mgnify:CR=1 FL=1